MKEKRPAAPLRVRVVRAFGLAGLLMALASLGLFFVTLVHHPQLNMILEHLFYMVANPPIAESLHGRLDAKTVERIELAQPGRGVVAIGDFLERDKPAMLLWVDSQAGSWNLVLTDMDGKIHAEVTSVPLQVIPGVSILPFSSFCAVFPRSGGRDGILILDHRSGMLRLVEPATRQIAWTADIPEIGAGGSPIVAPVLSDRGVEAVLVHAASKGVLVFVSPQGEVLERVPVAAGALVTDGDFDADGHIDVFVGDVTGEYLLCDVRGNVTRRGRLDIIHNPLAFYPAELSDGRRGIRVDYTQLVALYDFDGELVATLDNEPLLPMLSPVGQQRGALPIGNGIRLVPHMAKLAVLDSRGRTLDIIADETYVFDGPAMAVRPGEMYVTGQSMYGFGYFLVKVTFE